MNAQLASLKIRAVWCSIQLRELKAIDAFIPENIIYNLVLPKFFNLSDTDCGYNDVGY